MNKLILLFLFPFFLNAQNLYVESNFGIANIDGLGVFPGASVLFGKRFEKSESQFLLDMEIGLAFPSIVTAKIGGGVFVNKEKNQRLFLELDHGRFTCILKLISMRVSGDSGYFQSRLVEPWSICMKFLWSPYLLQILDIAGILVLNKEVISALK